MMGGLARSRSPPSTYLLLERLLAGSSAAPTGERQRDHTAAQEKQRRGLRLD